MRPSSRVFPSGIAIGLALSLVISAGSAVARLPVPGPDGFRTLTGADARAFAIPSDVRLVSRWSDARANLTFERYQQYAPASGAHVEGGQLTVGRRNGRIELVVGAHYNLVTAVNVVRLTSAAAATTALESREVSSLLARAGDAAVATSAELRLNPRTNRLFYRVSTDAFSALVYADIDAATGEVLNAWSALDEIDPGQGIGAKGDTKSLAGLTSGSNPHVLQSADGRLVTRDAKLNSRLWDTALGSFTDPGDTWDGAYQRVAVDAQYYASKTDSWYRDAGFDMLELVDDPENPGQQLPRCGMSSLTSVVHYDDTPNDGFGYDNAFWHPDRKLMVYGDGDGIETGPFSGSQDVVSHELSHAVTTCRAPLTYYWSSGALNEGFSDVIATAIEWQLAEPNSSACRRLTGQDACPDWWIGEDSIIAGTRFGFRDLSRPQNTGNPSHWADRYRGSFDNRGVHYNSMLPGHAFYLMSVGGRNARCLGPNDTKADCDVVVPAIGVDDASRLFFNTWGTLPEDADYCNAQAATIAAAKTLFPASDRHLASAVLGWAAIGLRADYPNTIGNPCAGDLPSLDLTTRSIALAENQETDIDVTDLGTDTLTVDVESPVTAQVNGSSVTLSVPTGTAPGAYSVKFTATPQAGPVLPSERYAVATVVVDASPPTAHVTQVALIGSGQISQSGTIQLQVQWNATDELSGLADADLEWTTNGTEPWPVLSTTPPPSGATSVLAGGTEYSFRVRATDGVGHVTLSDESGPWQIERSQENAAVYAKTWTTRSVSDYWGGGSKSAKTKGATATFTFNGTAVQWITNRGQRRGRAKIYLDGLFVSTVDLYASSASTRRIGYTVNGLADGNHTLMIWVMGTNNRPRVDIDGFVVLDPQ